MWYKVLLSAIAIMIVVTIQITLLGSFGRYWGSFNLVLAILAFLIFITSFDRVMFFAIISGFLLDIYSSLPFGIFLISIFLAVLVSELALKSFFTNRSFYSVLSMGLVIVVSFNISFLVFGGIAYLLGLSDFYIDRGYWLELLYQIINTLILMSIMFFIVNSLSKKFKPNFIRS